MTTIRSMNQRITIEQPPNTADSDGFPNTAYTDYVTCWASVAGGTASRIYGKDFIAAGEIQSENQLIFTIRYREDLNSDMRVRYRNQVYAIVAMVDKDGMRTYLDVMVKGWQNGGV